MTPTPTPLPIPPELTAAEVQGLALALFRLLPYNNGAH